MEDFIMNSYLVYLLKCGIIDLKDLKYIYDTLEREEQEERENKKRDGLNYCSRNNRRTAQ